MALETKASRINEAYLVQQVEAFKSAQFWKQHKARIAAYDRTYGGSIPSTVPAAEENSLPDEPYIENKLKNATHDIKRLATEAKGMAVFTKKGEDDTSKTHALVQETAVETIWEEGGGADNEGQFYLDLVRGGFAAVAIYADKAIADYAQFLRLDPALSYPTVVNGKLRDMVYVERMLERGAAHLFPNLGLDDKPTNNREVEIVMVFTKTEVVQGVCFAQQSGKGNARKAEITNRWVHKLGRVPVAFKALETADGAFRGLLDQLQGPMKARNRAARLMVDYLDDLVHSPWEEKGIENSDILPGPTVVYHHNEDAEFETFMRRTAPAAPAGAVFGLIQFLEAQEQSEGFQPPSRVGQIRQSQATGSFVESTQGALSSVVIELQKYVAQIRRDANKLAMMVEEKHLDYEKPLIRAVGQKTTYLPSEDFGGWYYHKVLFGAAAGLDRREADSRILQHLGAGLIPRDKAREQIDYIENDANIADDVDRDLLSTVMFQRLTSDQSVTFADLAELWVMMGKGMSRQKALEKVLPRLLQRQQEQAAAQAEAGGIRSGGPTPEGQTPVQEGAALDAGAAPGTSPVEFADLNPRPFLQAFGGETGR